ncbi:phosphoribosylamine--glycine ligase [Kroppenstedtia sanguinis]|uniref:Phosphoribosylamine--glycine ligase n=1 Tax=Kroppenstedtia sanguinis TaxID=1380684 RepID=A0ABW4CCT1_9BACL
MRVLVIGSGGREHALLWKLMQSPQVTQVYCTPGNGGMGEHAVTPSISPTDGEALVRFAQENQIDLTVVGPEASLMAGVVDTFEKAGLAVFGPRKNAAQVEGSKRFAKDLMDKYGIPTGRYRAFKDSEAAIEYIREQGAPIVVKADGLAAGKGVIVARTLHEAEKAVEDLMTFRAFGKAGEEIVVEEYLEGEEISLMAFVDGETVRPMVPAQDHKPVFDGDQGPNTGGMGAYSPVLQISEERIQQIVMEILEPMARGMEKEGLHYRGVLYAGLMMTAAGPKVIEFNARFGDPETQVVLPRLDSDLAEILLAVTEGRLQDLSIQWKPEASVCVVMASAGYPGDVVKGKEIQGLSVDPEDTMVFHAGTAWEEGTLVTAGGRVLAVTSWSVDLQSAREAAYRRVESISFEGVHYRRDIGIRGVKAE